MPNFCNVVVCGHLGQDARLKTVKDQTVLEMSIAYNARKDNPPSWFNAAIWGSRGEKLAPMLKKGTAVIVSGQLTPRPYNDKDGNPRISLDIRVDQFSFAGSKGERVPSPQSDADRVAMAKEIFLSKQAEVEEDPDIPF